MCGNTGVMFTQNRMDSDRHAKQLDEHAFIDQQNVA